MKKLIISLTFLIPALLTFGQDDTNYPKTVDRAMPYYSRTLMNDNFTQIFAETDSLDDVNTAHGQLYFDSQSATVSISADSTWYNIADSDSTLWTSGNLYGMTEAGDTITITVPGDYIGFLNVDFAATADDTVQVALFKNGTIATRKATVATLGVEVTSASLSFYLDALVAGDDLSIKVQQLVTTDNVTFVAGDLLIYRKE